MIAVLAALTGRLAAERFLVEPMMFQAVIGPGLWFKYITGSGAMDYPRIVFDR